MTKSDSALSALQLVKLAGFNPENISEQLEGRKHARVIRNTITSILANERELPADQQTAHAVFVDNVVRIAIQVAKDRNNDYELRQAALKNLGRLYEGSRFRANFKTALYAAAENIADSMPVDELGDTAQDVMTRINLRSEKPARPRPNLH